MSLAKLRSATHLLSQTGLCSTIWPEFNRQAWQPACFFAHRKEAANVKVWQLALLVMCLAQLFCAGCVGGKLLDPSAARLLDDNRHPRPYPTGSLARARSAQVATAAKPPPVGTGVEASANAKPIATPVSSQEATEVTLANRHQHVGDQTSVLQIPPSRIGASVSSRTPSDSEATSGPVATTGADDQPRAVQAPEPVQSPLAAPPPSLAAKAEAPATPMAPIENAKAADAAIPSTSRPQGSAVTEELPEVSLASASVSESAPGRASFEVAAPESPHVELPTVLETADQLLPEDPTERLDWLQTRHIEAIEQATKRAREAGNKEEAARLDQQLRLAYLIANDIDEASRGIETLPDAEREAYKQFMFGLSQFLSEEDYRRPSHRNARVAKALRDAIRELTPASRLELKNLTFCERVEQFGWFTEFRRAEFAPKQQVILYVEVENATAEEKSKHNFETELAGSYQIFDEAGRLAHERTLPLDKETCRNYRRDYFLAYRIYLPDDIAPGHYRLELTIEDMKAKRSGNRKLGEAMIEFRVRS
jgi:hypothetical protein